MKREGITCENPYCGEIYPHYGVAPHVHDIKETGSFIGSTKFLPKDKWPDNFKEDLDAPGLGTYYCPKCKSGF